MKHYEKPMVEVIKFDGNPDMMTCSGEQHPLNPPEPPHGPGPGPINPPGPPGPHHPGRP